MQQCKLCSKPARIRHYNTFTGDIAYLCQQHRSGELYHDFGYGPVPAIRHPNGGGLIASTAIVDREVYVGSHAAVSGTAVLRGSRVKLHDYSSVSGQAVLSGRVELYENAIVGSNAVIDGADIYIWGRAAINGNATLRDSCNVGADSRVSESATIQNYATIEGNAIIRGRAVIKDAARVGGRAVIDGDQVVSGDALVTCNWVQEVPLQLRPRVGRLQYAYSIQASTSGNIGDTYEWNNSNGWILIRR